MGTTTTITQGVPTAIEARLHTLSGTIRKAAKAAKADGQTRYVAATYREATVTTDEAKLRFTPRYFRVFADHVQVIERAMA